MLRFALPGEPHYQVCSNGTAGEIFSQQADVLVKIRRSILPVHPLKDLVAAALQGQMKMPAEFFYF